jgi:chloride channel protein, CIC family
VPEDRLRILVACGAAGGIAATFNAPITGVFFGVEIIVREFSIDALFTVMLAAMIADITAIPFLGDKPFLSGFPPGIALHHARNYLLVAALAVIAALMGLAFKSVLYKTEDLCDRAWKGRPEWARPAVGGLALGLLLLAFAKIAACSLTIGIGGSGGIFAPSLFIGVTSGMAFGDVAHHIFGPAAGQPALYAVVAMGAVFASAARAPLTSLASVVEMTGDFALTLPVMLAVAIASTISRALSYGTIYTTKLLRRGTDIDRATPWRALSDLKVASVMRPFRPPLPVPPDTNGSTLPDWAALAGPVSYQGDPQALFGTESVAQALRQLEVYGRDGLPVLSADGHRIQGWITAPGVLRSIARQVSASQAETTQAQVTADWEHGDPQSLLRHPPTPLPGYRLIEITVTADSPGIGRKLQDVAWPRASIPLSVLRGRRLRPPRPELVLTRGDRVSLLTSAADGSPARSAANGNGHQPATDGSGGHE